MTASASHPAIRDHCLAPGRSGGGPIYADPESFRVAEADWRPTLPSAEPGRYTLMDLLRAPELAAA